MRPEYAEVYLGERCCAMHEAIRGGRTALVPYTRQMPMSPGDCTLDLYRCPHCGTTVSRRLEEETVSDGTKK